MSAPEKMFDPRGKIIHMAGIGGVGMAGLALLLQQQGGTVSGCDAVEGPLLPWLRGKGIPCAVGHDPAHLMARPDALIRSPAVSMKHPELQEARRHGIPILDRGQVLPILLRDYRTVAVAGTHGKTTTASMIAWIMHRCGKKPSYCIGGVCPGLGAVAHAETGGWMVAEADESDGTLQHYHSEIAVITAMDLDHVDYFRDDETQRAMYAAFAGQARVLITSVSASALLPVSASRRRTFGMEKGAGIRASAAALLPHGCAFDVTLDGKYVGQVSLLVSGRHNVLNALAAMGAALEAGLDFGEIAEALATFSLPRRRFEQVADGNGIRVYSDYAHHPVEIEALLAQAALLKPRRITAVFQPHRYSRTLAFRDAFVRALAPLDVLVLAPVYSASEPFIPGGTSEDLFAAFDRREKVLLAGSLEEAWTLLRGHAAEGDLILIIGAGDVEHIGEWAAREWGIHGKEQV